MTDNCTGSVDTSDRCAARAGPRHNRFNDAVNLSTRRLVERAGWVPFGCAIGVFIMVAVAGLTWTTSPYWGRGNAQAKARDVGVIPTKGGTLKDRPAAAAAAAHLSPNRVEIPRLNEQAQIVKVGTMSDGQLDVPLNPRVVGWWSPGAKPGAKKGTAIFAGHINYSGVTGALAEIGTLNPGDTVLVFGKHHHKRTELTFSVTGVRTYHKTGLPYRQIFDQHVAGRLVLVTCGGPFDASTGNYLDNIVAFAVPVAAKRL
jgi:hypothetical protein